MDHQRQRDPEDSGDLLLASKAFLVGWTSAQSIISGLEPPPKAGSIGVFLEVVADHLGRDEVDRRTAMIVTLLEEAHDEIEERRREGAGDREVEGEGDAPVKKSLRVEDRARGYERWVRRAATTSTAATIWKKARRPR